MNNSPININKVYPQVIKLFQEYNYIAQNKMVDVPICNKNLSVETVGFREFEGFLIGILITPWMMNLIVLENENHLEKLIPDQKRLWFFPSGKYDFFGINIENVGQIHSCSLFSPMNEFADQTSAHNVADEILTQLFTTNENEEVVASRRRLFGLSAKID